MVGVFANGPGDLGSIPCRVIPKTQKMVPDASLLNTQHYMVIIDVIAIEKRAFGAPSTTVANFTYILLYICIYSRDLTKASHHCETFKKLVLLKCFKRINQFSVCNLIILLGLNFCIEHRLHP